MLHAAARLRLDKSLFDSHVIRIIRFKVVCVLMLVGSEIGARADDDDAPLPPDVRRLGLVSFVLVSAWLIAACYRAIRTKPRIFAPWERRDSTPIWLERLLGRRQANAAGRGASRRNSVNKPNRRARE